MMKSTAFQKKNNNLYTFLGKLPNILLAQQKKFNL